MEMILWLVVRQETRSLKFKLHVPTSIVFCTVEGNAVKRLVEEN